MNGSFDKASFLLGVFITLVLSFVLLYFCATHNREWGWQVGYRTGQVDALTGFVAVEKVEQTDKTTRWVTSKPTTMDDRDYRNKRDKK